MDKLDFREILKLRGVKEGDLLALSASYRALQPLFFNMPIKDVIFHLIRVCDICRAYAIDEGEFSAATAEICRFDRVEIGEFLTGGYERAVKKILKKKRIRLLGEKKAKCCAARPSAPLNGETAEAAFCYFERRLKKNMTLQGGRRDGVFSPSDIAGTLFYLVCCMITDRMSKEECQVKLTHLLELMMKIYRINGCYPAAINAKLSRVGRYCSSLDEALLLVGIKLLRRLLPDENARILTTAERTLDLMKFFDRESLLFAYGMRDGKPFGGRYEKALSKGRLLYMLTELPPPSNALSDGDDSLDLISPFLVGSFFRAKNYSPDDFFDGKITALRCGTVLLNHCREAIGRILPFAIFDATTADVVEKDTQFQPYSLVAADCALDAVVSEGTAIFFSGQGAFAAFSGGKLPLFEVVTNGASLASPNTKVLKRQAEIIMISRCAQGKTVVKFRTDAGLTAEIMSPKDARTEIFLQDRNYFVAGDFTTEKPYAAARYFGERAGEFTSVIVPRSAVRIQFTACSMPNFAFSEAYKPQYLMCARLILSGRVGGRAVVDGRGMPKKHAAALVGLMGGDWQLVFGARRFLNRTEKPRNADIDLSGSAVAAFLAVDRERIFSPPFVFETCEKMLTKRRFSSDYRVKFTEVDFPLTTFSIPFERRICRLNETGIFGVKITLEIDGRIFSPFFSHSFARGVFSFKLGESAVYSAQFDEMNLTAEIDFVSGRVTFSALQNVGAAKSAVLTTDAFGGAVRRKNIRIVTGRNLSCAFDVFGSGFKKRLAAHFFGGDKRMSLAVNSALQSFFRAGESLCASPFELLAMSVLCCELVPTFSRSLIVRVMNVRTSTEKFGYALSYAVFHYVLISGDYEFLASTVFDRPLGEYCLNCINVRSQTPLAAVLKYAALRAAMKVPNLVANRSYTARGLLNLKRKIDTLPCKLLACALMSAETGDSRFYSYIMRAVNAPAELRCAVFSHVGEDALFQRECARLRDVPYSMGGITSNFRTMCFVYTAMFSLFSVRREGGLVRVYPRIDTDFHLSFKSQRSVVEREIKKILPTVRNA